MIFTLGTRNVSQFSGRWLTFNLVGQQVADVKAEPCKLLSCKNHGNDQCIVLKSIRVRKLDSETAETCKTAEKCSNTYRGGIVGYALGPSCKNLILGYCWAHLKREVDRPQKIVKAGVVARKKKPSALTIFVCSTVFKWIPLEP